MESRFFAWFTVLGILRLCYVVKELSERRISLARPRKNQRQDPKSAGTRHSAYDAMRTYPSTLVEAVRDMKNN